MKSDKKLRIAIIGGGAAGIVAAKSAIEEGLDCEVFESSNLPGGVWSPDGLAWKSMEVNISRFTGVFSDFSWEQAFPGKQISAYPTTPEMHAYLLEYIKHFKLETYIHTGRKVIRIIKKDKDWTIVWSEKEKIKMDDYAYVALATGRYQIPYIPDFHGLSNFSGERIHSSQYRCANDFSKNKSVLIVGGSLSGVAIATEMTNPVQHLISKPRWILPAQITLDAKGIKIPSDLFHSRKTYKPKNFDWCMKHCSAQNNIPEWKMTREIPQASVVSNTYIEKVQQGKIQVVKNEINHFVSSGVVLKDGSELYADTIIFCTGYKYDFSLFDVKLAQHLSHTSHWYDDTFHPDIVGLALIGINYQARGAIFPLVELQARWACSVFSGRLTLPSTSQMKKEIAKTSTRDGFSFSNSLAKKLGISDFEKFIQQDPTLYHLLMEGAIVPAQYRVCGFGAKLDLAKEHLAKTEEIRQSYLNNKVAFFNEKNSAVKSDNNEKNQAMLTSRL